MQFARVLLSVCQLGVKYEDTGQSTVCTVSTNKYQYNMFITFSWIIPNNLAVQR
jgi:hypothetical protein